VSVVPVCLTTCAQDASGATALHKACFNEHLECVRALLARKVDVDARDAEGATALHRAVCGRAIVFVLCDSLWALCV
jgi:hypothetical protein